MPTADTTLLTADSTAVTADSTLAGPLIGSPPNVLQRLQFLLPSRWFTVGATALRDATLQGIASALSGIYALLAYVRLQTRIATATDGWLDLIAFDFFGPNLPRRPGERDNAYRVRIQQALFRERNTRHAVVLILEQLTGQAPIIFEPQRAADAGGYGAYLLGYGVSGGYGSMSLPMQAFVTAFRPKGVGIPNIAGYNDPEGAYSTGSEAEYISAEMLDEIVTDADIYAAVESVRPTCATLWVQILNSPPIPPDAVLVTDTGQVIETDTGESIIV